LLHLFLRGELLIAWHAGQRSRRSGPTALIEAGTRKIPLAHQRWLNLSTSPLGSPPSCSFQWSRSRQFFTLRGCNAGEKVCREQSKRAALNDPERFLPLIQRARREPLVERPNPDDDDDGPCKRHRVRAYHPKGEYDERRGEDRPTGSARPDVWRGKMALTWALANTSFTWASDAPRPGSPRPGSLLNLSHIFPNKHADLWANGLKAVRVDPKARTTSRGSLHLITTTRLAFFPLCCGKATAYAALIGYSAGAANGG
jgi:hypothetical protein